MIFYENKRLNLTVNLTVFLIDSKSTRNPVKLHLFKVLHKLLHFNDIRNIQ